MSTKKNLSSSTELTDENLVTQSKVFPHRLCIAPMLDWTDRHARYFLRLITPHARLYTEMVTTGAVLHGDADRFLHFNEEEHPLALQLGGSDPEALAKACVIANRYDYDEINLNIGCPSDRVQSGQFGACLMADAILVRDCVIAMQESSNTPVTIKCRTGIDDMDSLDFLLSFVETIASSGCKTFIIHARKAWLSGLSPKQNREIPPLNYEKVYAVKKAFPDLEIVINGGVQSLEQCQYHLKHCDGVMIGREAYNNPFCLADIDKQLFNPDRISPTRDEILLSMLPYIEKEVHNGTKLNHISRHLLGLFNGKKGAKAFRRHISEHAHKNNAGVEVIKQALEYVSC